MTRIAFAVALLALACGGESAEFSRLHEQAGESGSHAAGQPTAGSNPIASGGSETQPEGGEPGVGGSGGVPIAVAGSGGTESEHGGSPSASTSGQSAAGSGGSLAAGGSAGSTAAGSGGSDSAGMTSGGAGQAGSASGGSGGEPHVSQCNADDVLDCNGIPNDGLNRINPDDCEAWKGDHDTCGGCDIKCGLSQVCKINGSPGAWVYYCQTP